MPFFTPPVRVTNPSVLGYKDRFSQSPMKFFSVNGRVGKGVNVFVMLDGSVSEVFTNWGNISKVYYGGHTSYVTAAEAAVLTAAGYTVDSVLYGSSGYGGGLYGG